MRLVGMLLAVVLAVAFCCCSAAAFGVSCGMNIPAPTSGTPVPVQASDLLAAGVSWVRIEYQDIERNSPAPSALAYYDQLIDALTGAGIRVLLLVDYTTWIDVPAFGAPCAPDWAQYRDGFVARLQALVTHYRGRVGAWEIWNEEDFANPSPSYDPSVREPCYADLLAHAYQTVKSVDANATVLVGGLASGDVTYPAALAKPNGLAADGVGIHPYGRRPTNDWPSPTWGFGPIIPFLQSYSSALGPAHTLPYWLTEMGDSDTNSQGDFPFHLYSALNGTTPHAWPVVFWFCWSDSMVPPFGLLDVNGNKKPSYYSYQKWCKA